ncbi:inorganic diphosphatase [Candidatus Kaiserbacteria bacterium]|nr:inorganic diphosphatase [Candidatus Kaiserbacteria bacterium]
MANLNIKPSLTMPNLLHVLPTWANESTHTVNAIVEVSSGSINKYEIINETGHLKLDRVGYSTLAYPFTYGAIPQTWDHDNDMLDIIIINVTEPLVAGSHVEARVVGGMKFEDTGEIDDKIIAVLAGDKRVDHITSYKDFGPYFQKETAYYFENYKALKKPGTGKAGDFLDIDGALKVLHESMERYEKDYKPKLQG